MLIKKPPGAFVILDQVQRAEERRSTRIHTLVRKPRHHYSAERRAHTTSLSTDTHTQTQKVLHHGGLS